jgi:DNA-binding protein H-NS
MQIESLSIEELAELRDKVIGTLNEHVTVRQRELQGEIDRLGGVVSSQPAKSSTACPKRAVKYRDGSNEWTGVGTMPAWAKLKGDTLESYRV